MDTLNIVQDSLLRIDGLDSTIKPIVEVNCVSNSGWVEIMAWLLPFLFSIVTYYIGLSRNKKNEKKSESVIEVDRRISLFKTLILDYNLKYVYDFFDELELVLSGLRDENCDKKIIEQQIQNKFKSLNEKFVYLLMAVDPIFYQKILNLSDNLRDGLVNSIFDEGVNLYIEKKYLELINVPYQDFKIKLLKFLIEYRG